MLLDQPPPPPPHRYSTLSNSQVQIGNKKFWLIHRTPNYDDNYYYFLVTSFLLDPNVCIYGAPTPKGLFPLTKQYEASSVLGSKRLNGKMINTRYVDGIDGINDTAIEFNGKPPSYIEIPRTYDLDAKWNITILVNVYPIGKTGPILAYHPRGKGVQIMQVDDGDEKFSSIKVTFRKRNIRYTIPLVANILERFKWNEIAARYTYETGVTTLFKDGKEISSVKNRKFMVATQYPIFLGSFKQKRGRSSFEGYMSCLQIYNEALTESEIRKSQYYCRSGNFLLR